MTSKALLMAQEGFSYALHSLIRAKAGKGL